MGMQRLSVMSKRCSESTGLFGGYVVHSVPRVLLVLMDKEGSWGAGPGDNDNFMEKAI